MKNTDIRPEDIVPIDIRKEVYTEAIKVIQSGKSIAALSSFALCLMLPCLLWDLETFLHNPTDVGGQWDFTDTSKMFPELTSVRLRTINSVYGNDSIDTRKLRDKQRIEILIEMLGELETL